LPSAACSPLPSAACPTRCVHHRRRRFALPQPPPLTVLLSAPALQRVPCVFVCERVRTGSERKGGVVGYFRRQIWLLATGTAEARSSVSGGNRYTGGTHASGGSVWLPTTMF
uniref:Uncharacterized protein n=1 Tax=Anopheles coluzzii TaxID=1518534 RepID=A0A8W7PJN6_ANOCL